MLCSAVLIENVTDCSRGTTTALSQYQSEFEQSFFTRHFGNKNYLIVNCMAGAVPSNQFHNSYCFRNTCVISFRFLHFAEFGPSTAGTTYYVHFYTTSTITKRCKWIKLNYEIKFKMHIIFDDSLSIMVNNLCVCVCGWWSEVKQTPQSIQLFALSQFICLLFLLYLKSCFCHINTLTIMFNSTHTYLHQKKAISH